MFAGLWLTCDISLSLRGDEDVFSVLVKELESAVNCLIADLATLIKLAHTSSLLPPQSARACVFENVRECVC